MTAVGELEQHHPSETSHLLHQSSSLRLEEDVPFYSRPRQRQRWDDMQIQPHVNWGDLFWDLFYVSAAFNLAAALKDSLNAIGILYFFSCFLPVYNVWLDKVGYDARYAPEDNLFHRMMEIFHILALGTIVQHIRPVETMSDPSHWTTLLFCLGLLAEALLSIYRQYDILRNVVGGPEAKENAQHDMRRKVPSLVFFAVASALSWKNRAFPDDSDGVAEPYHVPIIICLIAYLFEQFLHLSERYVFLPTGRSHKEMYVPLNLDFTIHRMGEWTMLMLGESVLALLIVEQSSGRQYYVTFYCGIITVTAFQYLFFRSQPFEPDDHAMRRSSSGGYLFGYSSTFYSASLIMVGCAYKMILHYFLEEEEGEEKTAEEAQRIANLFSCSSAMSFITLDLMLMSHRGVITNFARLRNGGECAIMPSLVTAIDYTLILALACLSSFTANLELLTVCGLVIVILQLLLRTRGMRYFPVSKKALEDPRPWPNTTVPRVTTIVENDSS